MSDISLPWNGDVVPDECGDILMVTNNDEIVQRVIRRLLTNPVIIDPSGDVSSEADYIWHSDYGGGVRAFVGRTVTPEVMSRVRNLIFDQMQYEDLVDRTINPKLTVTKTQDGIAVDLSVVSLQGAVVLIPQIEITQ